MLICVGLEYRGHERDVSTKLGPGPDLHRPRSTSLPALSSEDHPRGADCKVSSVDILYVLCPVGEDQYSFVGCRGPTLPS